LEHFTLHAFGYEIPSLDGPLPLLRLLDVELSHRQPFASHQMPLLRTACLTGIAVPHLGLPWLQLTCLTVRYISTSTCTTVLQKTTNLVHCKLDLSGPGSDQLDIVLPSLESLTFDRTGHTPGYLNSFIVPALRSLDIPERSLVLNPIRSLKSFISKSGCRLQEVHITGERTVSEDSYRETFPSIPKFSFEERL
jgi:hypothetical protein